MVPAPQAATGKADILNEAQREELRKIAQKYNLIVTGGSDFHGLYNAQPTHLGSNSTSKENLDRIIKLANKKEA